MKKIEDLLKLDTGNYDTPKKLNRSARAIPRSFIDQIEASEITSETLAQIVRAGFPVYRYKTCITIHGQFDLESVPRIGGYKNLIQNKNGSLEIRYNAIDFQRKKKILRELMDVSEFRGYTDSTGTYLQMRLAVETLEDANEKKAKLFAILNRIRSIDFYGKGFVYLAATMWGRCLVLDVILDAIQDEQTRPFVLAASGLDALTLDTLLAEKQKERDRREAEYKSEREAREKVNAALEAKRLELEKVIAGKPLMPYAVGAHGVKAVSMNGQATYKFVRIMGKGSFGRFKYDFGFGPNIDAVRFQTSKKERKPKEIGQYIAV